MRKHINNLMNEIDEISTYNFLKQKEQAAIKIGLRKLILLIDENTDTNHNYDYIIQYTCEYFNIARKTLFGKTRKQEIVRNRQFLQYFLKQYTSLSLSKIGKNSGLKNHSTILYSIRTLNGYFKTDKLLKQKYLDYEFYILKKLNKL